MELLNRTSSATEFLHILVDNWNKYLLYLHHLISVLFYLDRYLVAEKKTSVCIEGHKAYKYNYFDKIKDKLI